MSFGGRTPESLVARSDSRNAATTCRGLTTNGRPCRRALSSSPSSLPDRKPRLMAVGQLETMTNMFCWQHQGQAEHVVIQQEHKPLTYPLRQKESIDTLINRIGVLNLQDETHRKKPHRRASSDEEHLTTDSSLLSNRHKTDSHSRIIPEEKSGRHPQKLSDNRHRSRSNVKLSWTCCIQADDDGLPPSRPHPQSYQTQPSSKLHRYSEQHTAQHRSQQVTRGNSSRPIPQMVETPETISVRPRRPLPPLQDCHFSASESPQSQRSTSQTQSFLSLIPQHLTPQTTSQLLAELSRPIPPTDEPGYIYIFWLTPSSIAAPDDETASTILDTDCPLPTSTKPHPGTSYAQAQTNSDLQQYAHPTVSTGPGSNTLDTATTRKTITLKIGRATNVHRRLSQWSKQCGQNITLVRYYPYCPPTSTKTTHSTSAIRRGTTTNQPAPTPRKVVYATRVERLIHIELSDKRAIKAACEQCGRVHREWFEIEATRKGLRNVDEVVRRWCAWAETLDNQVTDRTR